jgi:hypothetical protein
MKRPSLLFLALFSLSATASIAATTPATAPPAPPAMGSTGITDPLALVEGTWGYTEGPRSCQNNPQTTTLSPDRTTVKLEFRKAEINAAGKPQKSEVYKILDARARLLHTVVEGEPRKDKNGQPLMYDFLFASESSFCFHRSDWPKGQCTKMLVRCPGSKRP